MWAYQDTAAPTCNSGGGCSCQFTWMQTGNYDPVLKHSFPFWWEKEEDCLSPFQLLQQNTIDWVVYIENMYFVRIGKKKVKLSSFSVDVIAYLENSID